MNEATKSKSHWGQLEASVLQGAGIDIGCGVDPVTLSARRFDLEDGDANKITEYVKEKFDFVFSSHCLEHMHNPQAALLEWYQLVKPGGYLFFIVPDEDLYEQGVFPSRFNSDHKATFTISKIKSWSPKSYNVFDLARSLPSAEILKLALNDLGYDRALAGFGLRRAPWARGLISIYKRLSPFKNRTLDSLVNQVYGLDQTINKCVSAQIECIVKKTCSKNF
jgi:SAM-dependent methyltransferase